MSIPRVFANTAPPLLLLLLLACVLALTVHAAESSKGARSRPRPVCVFDEAQRRVARHSVRSLLEQEQTYTTEEDNSTVLGALRIKLDVMFLRGAPDRIDGYAMACTSVGQQVLKDGRTYTCTEADIASEEQRDYAAKVTSEVTEKLARMLKVNQVRGKLKLESGIYGGVLSVPTAIEAADTDLYVYATMRPADEGVYATGQILSYDQNGRTVLGLINWNPRSVDPSGSSDELATVALHEFFHVLGFAQGRFEAFRTADNEPYDEPVTFCARLDDGT